MDRFAPLRLGQSLTGPANLVCAVVISASYAGPRCAAITNRDVNYFLPS